MHLTFWGKARPDDQAEQAWHPAALHSVDVAAVASVWLEAHPASAEAPARASGWDTGAWRSAVPFLVALHDVGKWSRSFQIKAPAHWPTALGAIDAADDPGHDTVGFALLTDLDSPPAALNRVFVGWDTHLRDPLLRAVTGHHGRPPNEATTFHGLPRRVACATCRAALSEFASAVR